jgi:streptomycin 6-kinase
MALLRMSSFAAVWAMAMRLLMAALLVFVMWWLPLGDTWVVLDGDGGEKTTENTL